MGTKSDKPSHKKWHCDRCGATYNSPLPVTAVRCGPCAKINSKASAWMKPDLEEH